MKFASFGFIEKGNDETDFFKLIICLFSFVAKFVDFIRCCGGGPQQYQYFIVDHGFYYAIINSQRVVLFSGAQVNMK